MLSNKSKFPKDMLHKTIMFSLKHREFYTLQIIKDKDMHKKDSSWKQKSWAKLSMDR